MASAKTGLATNRGAGPPRASASGTTSPTAAGGRREHHVPAVEPPSHGAPCRGTLGPGRCPLASAEP
eukprot:4381880-Alexandrium_andersonii.AAC.1